MLMGRGFTGPMALAVCAGALAACASGPPPAPQAPALPVPAAWSVAGPSGATTPLAAWWQRFDDPLLVALINEALHANTSVRSAVAALAQSRAVADVQSAGLLPSLRGSASAQRSRNGNAGTGNSFRAGFDASWEPDVFGGQHASVAAAEADTLASAANLGAVQVSIAAEVAVDYMQWRGLQARLAIARSNLASQSETLQITQWRAQAGLLTALEVEQARAATAQTQAQIPQLQSAAALSEHSLAILTWRAPAELHDRLAAPAPAVLTPPDNLVLAFPADTLRQRPDVRAAEARINAAAQRVLQADAARYPSFTLSGSLGLNAVTLAGLTHGSAIVAALLGSVSGPIFDGGAAQAQVRAQRASLEQAASAYDAAVLTALKEVEDSLITLRNNRERLQSLRTAAEAAQNAATLARQRYGSGLVDFQVVLETQRTLLNAQDGVASTVAELNADHVRLYKALGGGWERSDATRLATDSAQPTRPNSP